MKRHYDGENNPFDFLDEEDNTEAQEHVTIDEAGGRSFLEETSAEFTHPIEADERQNNVQHIYGWIALALSIVSFFFIPFLFSIAGIIVGFVARNRGSVFLGISAIVVGALSFLFNLFLLPMM